MKIIFAGTPEFAARHLAALLQTSHEICAVYTQPDRPAGRGKKLQTSPVKVLGLENNIPVVQPISLKNEADQRILADFSCDLMIVVAYGLLLPKAVLDTPRLGCINVHGSLLPRWRGAAPIQRAIEAGDTISGITIMQMDVGLDTGDMLLKSECPINPEDTSKDLHDRLAELGPVALVNTLALIEGGESKAEKQDDSLSNYAKKIEKHEAEINWREDADMIDRKIRAFNPFPICFSIIDQERIRIHKAHISTRDKKNTTPGKVTVMDTQILVDCGQGVIAIDSLQLPGKKAMSTEAFLNGFSDKLHDQCFKPSAFISSTDR